MKKIFIGKKKILTLVLSICAACICVAVVLFATLCKKEEPELIDYAAQVTLDMNSESIKQEVTVNAFIDGDTTHFKVPSSIVDGTVIKRDILKARYLAVNTPESTGKIEEWGKKAAAYTKSHLSEATSIIIETDGSEWAVDSTGERYLVWVWYKTPGMTEYRNLNLELLQNGLAVGSKASETRYGDIAVKAIDQASRFKLHVHSEETDPDFYYGAAQELELKELRLNIANYVGARVAFEGNVSQYDSQGVYVEEYDEETQLYYGVYVYYGFFLSNEGEAVLLEGNRVRVVGVVSYWETGKSYQISDLDYDPFEPDDPENIQLISRDNPVANTETTAETFLGKTTVTIIDESGEEISELRDYAEVAINTSISMKNLVVQDAYTTDNGGDNDGAITLTCTVDGKTVKVRTTKLYNPDMSLVTEDKFIGKTIDVVGIIDSYDGEYQIKVFSIDDITIHE